MHVFNFARNCVFAVDNRQYSAEFLCQLQYCPAALVRPADLELIPGVTDRTPGDKFTLLMSGAPAVQTFDAKPSFILNLQFTHC